MRRRDVRDAENAGPADIAEFFRHVMSEDSERADGCPEYLAKPAGPTPENRDPEALTRTSASAVGRGEGATIRTVETITLDDARRVIAAAEKEAENQGQPMNIAVVDAGGVLVAHIRQDRAWIGSVDVAINKAFSARAFDTATLALGENAEPGGQYYGIQDSNNGRVMIFAGGVPLMHGDDVVGAVGVSGGTGEQDQAVASAAAAAL